MPHAIPIKIPEPEYLQFHAAARWLAPPDRNAFVAAVANTLVGQAIGPGYVARAIADAFRAFYRPIEVSDEPKLLAKLNHERRFEAELERREAHRTRRLRSDAR